LRLLHENPAGLDKLLGGLPLSPSSKRPWPCASLGVTVARVMTDNGSCYGSRMFQKACKWFGLKHIRLVPRRPAIDDRLGREITGVILDGGGIE